MKLLRKLLLYLQLKKNKDQIILYYIYSIYTKHKLKQNNNKFFLKMFY